MTGWLVEWLVDWLVFSFIVCSVLDSVRVLGYGLGDTDEAGWMLVRCFFFILSNSPKFLVVGACLIMVRLLLRWTDWLVDWWPGFLLRCVILVVLLAPRTLA